MRARILELLGSGPRHGARDRRGDGLPTHEVLFWVMGMRRFGRLHEIEGADRRRLLPLRSHRGAGHDHPRRHRAAQRRPRFGAADVSSCFSAGLYGFLPARRATTPPSRGASSATPRSACATSSSPARSCGPATPAACAPTLPDGRRPERVHGCRAAIRRRHYDRTGLARMLYTRPIVGTIIAVPGLLRRLHGRGPREQRTESLDIFGHP